MSEESPFVVYETSLCTRQGSGMVAAPWHNPRLGAYFTVLDLILLQEVFETRYFLDEPSEAAKEVYRRIEAARKDLEQWEKYKAEHPELDKEEKC